MAINQSMSKDEKAKLILALILAVFFLKGVFLATLFPMFTGQDEARHYNSIQTLNEPEYKTWDKLERMHKTKKDTFDDYNFSQEIIESGKATEFDNFRHALYETVNFSDNSEGRNEQIINSKIWKSINFYFPPDTGGETLYHRFGFFIERILEENNILVRFFSNRIFSVLLGTVSIFLAYLIAKNAGFSARITLLITAIVAFQPKFAMYFTNINYDVLLIPLFFLFTLGGILSLKNGPNWKNIALMIFAVIAGILTKGTAVILLFMFLAIIAYHMKNNMKQKIGLRKTCFIFIGLIFLITLINFTEYNFIQLLPFKDNFSTTLISLGDYLSESLTPGRFALSARTYWGALGWNDDFVADNFTDIIWYAEIIAGIGILYFLFSKKKPEFLPEKKYIIFLIGMVAALQLGVRIADLNVFMNLDSLALGTPGRYFLPNLASHIILLFVGLGALVRSEKYFRYSLATGMILMFSFSMYLIFNVILPRYYL